MDDKTVSDDIFVAPNNLVDDPQAPDVDDTEVDEEE